MVYDGKFKWIEFNMPGSDRVSVSKNEAGSSTVKNIGDWRMAAQEREQFDLTLAAEDTLDGDKTWVLEGPLREEQKAQWGKYPPEKVRMFVSQSDCMARQILFYDKDGKEFMDDQFTNVKTNQPVDPALFKYTPPDGVKINDMTGGVLPAPKEKTPKDDEKRNEE